ncbi:MAG: hypothetical protein M3Y07_01890 [Acidobacteriota bacterium]|nr:hypothetical protein [Acidobacteriota bacterium]
MVKLTVTEARPLAQALEVLSVAHGLQINYEDPTYSSADDVIDKTNPQYKQQHPTARAVLPISRSLQFEYLSAGRGRPLPDPSAVLRSLIGTYNALGFPGVFELRQTGDIFHVVPIQEKSHGKPIPYVSPLDTPISLPEQERSGIETIDAICRAINQVLGKNEIHPGAMPNNMLREKSVLLNANHESARSVLLRAFVGLHWKDTRVQEPARKLVWDLLRDTTFNQFVLNLRIAMREVPGMDGGVRQVPL